MRLDKLLLAEGYGSRKTIKRLIVSKQVQVDQKIVLQENLNVDPDLQEIRVGERILKNHRHVYYVLNKPKGVVTAVTDKKNQTVMDLIAPADRRGGLFPVGRLDKDTEGLLLLTDNGQLAYQLIMPNKQVTKTYEAWVNEPVTDQDVLDFAKGIVFLGGATCRPAKLTVLKTIETCSYVRLEISEGKFHQVKKMFLAVGKKVTYLKRTTMGPLALDPNLELGEYRSLTPAELDGMKPYFK